MRKPTLDVATLGEFVLTGFRSDPLPTLKRVSKALSEFNYHVSAGTMLGIYRDHKFIEHDTDIDIAVVVDKYNANLEESVVKALGDRFELVRRIKSTQGLEQLVFVDLDNWRMLVDIEIYYTNIEAGRMIHIKPEGMINLPIYKTKKFVFQGVEINIPDPIENYLADRYGEWKVSTKAKGNWMDYTKCFVKYEGRALKILAFPVGQDGCSGYRVRKPLEGLKLYTDHDVHIIDKDKDDMKNIAKIFAQADVVWMRPGAEKGREEMLKIFNKINIKLNTKWVMDIDDNLELVNPYSEFYRGNGTKEFTHNGVKIWEDGKKGFDIARNKEKIASELQGLRDVDMVVTTTKTLANYANQFNDNVYINDNTIDFNVWWKIEHKPNKPLKVLWAGSPSHYADFYTIKDPLNKLMKEFDFEILMAGSNYPGIFEDKSRVKSLPWVVFNAHSYRMMALQADIAIIPLAEDDFNKHKSSIKFYEVSAMALPAVVSDVTPYNEAIHNDNALPYKTEDEFYSQMKKLLESATLRKKIGNKAYNWVRNNKNLKDESIKLGKRLEELCQTKQ